MSNTRQKPTAFATCAWCGQHKPISELRAPTSSRGKTPSTCHACRESHPTLGWCDDHNETHPIERFPVDKARPIGRFNICRDAVAYRAAQKRNMPQRECVACERRLDSWFFRGGRNKGVACRDCEDSHAGMRWCVDCADWLVLDQFSRTGSDGQFMTVRCRTCRIANDHGVTRALLAQITGSDTPECGACGSRESIKIDHDHNHCPSRRGCGECVRGYLCHSCNTAEGLLRTPERARLLADYMERFAS